MHIITAIFALTIILTAAVIAVLTGMRMRYDARADRIWIALAGREDGGETFSPEMVEGLPSAVRTYFLHALRPGTPIPQSVTLTMSGTIRVSEKADWIPFHARQILCGPKGFVWKAKVKIAGPLTISGADCYFRGEGQVRFFLLGIFPIAKGSGDTVSRSAAGRARIESVWLPTALLPQRGASWEAIDDRRAAVTLGDGQAPSTITITFSERGEILSAAMPRYRGDGNGPTGPLPFGIIVEEQRRFAGITIPARIRAGWELESARSFEFIRIHVEDAQFS